MAVYKVSIVVTSGEKIGTILTLKERPTPGDILRTKGRKLRVTEVIQLMPSRGETYFLHLTCQLLEH